MKKLTNKNSNKKGDKMENSERFQYKNNHIKLCDLLTTKDPIDEHLNGRIGGFPHSNIMTVKLCKVRITFYVTHMYPYGVCKNSMLVEEIEMFFINLA